MQLKGGDKHCPKSAGVKKMDASQFSPGITAGNIVLYIAVIPIIRSRPIRIPRYS